MAFKILEDAGFVGRLRSVPETSHGPDVAWLRREIEKSEQDWKSTKDARGEKDKPLYKPKPRFPKTFKHLVYMVPNHSNPSGVTTSLEVRKELVKCARDVDALIMCDDVYDMLHWSSKPREDDSSAATSETVLPRIIDVDRYLPGGDEDGFGNAISNGTFSKICAPGVRCGWVEGTDKLAELIAQVGVTKSGGAACQMTSTFIDDLLTSGELKKHISSTLQPAYRERWLAMMSAIKKDLEPLGVTVKRSAMPEIAGGYFIWLFLPEALQGRAADVTKRCLDEESLIVSSGRSFQVPGDREGEFDSNIRLCFAWEAQTDLVEGVSRLAAVLQRMLSNQ